MNNEAEPVATASRRIDWDAVACAASVVLLIGVAAGRLYQSSLPFTPAPWHWALAFGIACAPAIVTAWITAIIGGHLPARPGGEPKLNHISGWSFLLIALAVSVIIGLATWAASGEATRESIDAQLGIVIVFALAIAFTVAALAPGLNLAERSAGVVRLIGGIIKPFGRLLSIFDSVLVFVVAGSAGVTRETTWMRYALLFGILIPCGVLGYWMPPPFGLIPIAWGFLVAISMSRRWAWIEDDRELAMLNRRFIGSHLRIGFSQDMRDEALLSFMSMFFLIPLALRQAQIAALDTGFPLFSIDRAGAENLWTWIAFFGTELAKAVPFVDWAEIYNVGGSDDDIVRTPTAQHFVFATRILVDLVFLAALLQALSISARNAKQRQLFYDHTLDRLDPFIEPQEFKKLVTRVDGTWLAVEAKVKAFPPYDQLRLVELRRITRPGYLSVAAAALQREQGSANSAELHVELLRRATDLKEGRDSSSKEEVMEVVLAIRASGAERDVNKLDETRRILNGVPRIIELRSQVMRLLLDAPNAPERTRALLGALVSGPNRDWLGPVRALAIAGLAEAAALKEPGVVEAIREAAEQTDSTNGEKREAKAIVRRLNLDT